MDGQGCPSYFRFTDHLKSYPFVLLTAPGVRLVWNICWHNSISAIRKNVLQSDSR